MQNGCQTSSVGPFYVRRTTRMGSGTCRAGEKMGARRNFSFRREEAVGARPLRIGLGSA